MTRQLKTSRVFVPGTALSRDRFYPLIRISGKWLLAHGFREDAPLYVTETMNGLLISPHPPAPAQLSPLETIKEEFKALGIETEQRVKPKRIPAPNQSVAHISFDFPQVAQSIAEELPDTIPPEERKFFKLTQATRKEYENY